MKNKLLYLLLFIIANSSYGQTNVSGGLFSDTTWNTAGSPYIVTADIALFPGYTLTIEPGVAVKFNSNTKLIIRGTLLASGDGSNKITFTSNVNNPTNGSWSGIEVENNQGGKIIASHIIGEYADNFIRIMNSSSGEVLNIDYSEIKNCNRAFYGYSTISNYTVNLDNMHVHDTNNYAFLYAQNLTLTNSVFSDGYRGIHHTDSNSNVSISNSEFFNFSDYPFRVVDSEVDNCYIHHNNAGVITNQGLIVKNSTIEFNNIGVLIMGTSATSFNIFDNKICDNTQYNLKHTYSSPISIINNCWCSNDENEISQTIFDALDDINLGIVTFTPYNTTCSSTLSTETIVNNINDLSIYPNPSLEEITLSKNIEGNYKIYSLNGTLVSQGIITKKINVSQLSQGVYFLKIFDKNLNEYLSKKLIKQ